MAQAAGHRDSSGPTRRIRDAGDATRVGLISDTHGKLRAEAVGALRDCSLILHAGDIGRPQVLEQLREVTPRLVAVRGNVDGEWAADLPEQADVEVAGHRVLLLHDLKRLVVDPRAAGYAAVVSGHSHQPRIERRDGVLYVNPGSAGPRRFHLPVAVALLMVWPTRIAAEIVPLAV